jgi:hypothetical protein
LYKSDGGVHALHQRVRGLTVLVHLRTQDDDGVGVASVVGAAEERHLYEGEREDADDEDDSR